MEHQNAVRPATARCGSEPQEFERFGGRLGSENKPGEHARQEAIAALRRDFAAGISSLVAASGWRVTIAMLRRAIDDLDRGNFVDAERHRRIAREQFIDGTLAFHQIPSAPGAAADWILAREAPR